MTFLDVVMPERFVLECLTPSGDWIAWGEYRAEEFERQEDGAYLNAAEGSPMWLRCLRQDGAVIYVIDGGGDPYTYRLVSPLSAGGAGQLAQPSEVAEGDKPKSDWPIAQLRDPETGELMSTTARYSSGPSAKIIDSYDDYDPEAPLSCPGCGWSGFGRDADSDHFSEVVDVSCPACNKMLLVIGIT